MNKFSLMKFAALIAAPLLVSACASMQSGQLEKSVDVVKPVESRPDGSVRFDTENEQVARLWIAAEKARSEKRNAIALELLYDALELSPQNSLLWSRAAELQLDSLEAALAENYAVKSNSFAGDNNALLYRNWLIIEHARSMRGDLLGVRSAHKKVQQFRYQ
jgi:hypothetical protein